MSDAPPPAPGRAAAFALFSGHPQGLRLLFFTELWERFSYYGMRALLIFYLTQAFLFTDDVAYAIYGSYTALVYVGPILGGLLADRILGAKRAVAFGSILIALGHFTLALGGLVSVATEGGPAFAVADPSFGTQIIRDPRALQILFLALALIATGEAFFKANISTIVGRLYAPGDKRRDAGFTLFYLGINIGALAATLLCGWLGQKVGWHYGFGLAGFGMLIALGVFLAGIRGLGAIGEAPAPERLGRRVVSFIDVETLVYLGGVGFVAIAYMLVQAPAVMGSTLGLSCLVGAGALLSYAFWQASAEARDRLLVMLTLSIFAVVFFALFEQAGSSLNLFADRNVERDVFGNEIPAAQLQSLNPGFIILLAPLFSRLWPALARSGREPSTPMKFALGLAQAGAGFALLVVGATYAGTDGSVALIWLVLGYLLFTTGELSLSPIGLSMITKLAPQTIVGFAMGIWFLATAAAQFLAAELARVASVPVQPDGSFDKAQGLAAYTHLFGMLAIVAFVAALLLVVLHPILRKRMHGAD